jgi:signal transduction histidine kinase
MDDQYLNNRLFEGTSRNLLAGFDLPMTERRYAPGEVVFAEGDPGKHMYLVGSGSVRISKKGRGDRQETLGFLKPGDFFGEIALLEDTPRSARISAAEDTVLAEIDAAGLQQIIVVVPEVGLNFARFTMQRLSEVSTTFIDELKQAERLSLVGSMVGSIVHDFKNPISTIKQVIYFLRRREDDEQMQELADYLSQSIASMLDMMQELLDFARGKSSVNLGRVTPGELMTELDNLILNHLDDRVAFTRDIRLEGAFVADLTRLTRLLTNIIKNAVEAMENGGNLRLSLLPDGDQVRFEITDTGCGIPPEVLGRIFEPFVTHGKSGGTGLGMAIARSIVEAHQGRIWVESTVGEGTTFFITIPRNLAPPA